MNQKQKLIFPTASKAKFSFETISKGRPLFDEGFDNDYKTKNDKKHNFDQKGEHFNAQNDVSLGREDKQKHGKQEDKKRSIKDKGIPKSSSMSAPNPRNLLQPNEKHSKFNNDNIQRNKPKKEGKIPHSTSIDEKGYKNQNRYMEKSFIPRSASQTHTIKLGLGSQPPPPPPVSGSKQGYNQRNKPNPEQHTSKQGFNQMNRSNSEQHTEHLSKQGYNQRNKPSTEQVPNQQQPAVFNPSHITNPDHTADPLPRQNPAQSQPFAKKNNKQKQKGRNSGKNSQNKQDEDRFKPYVNEKLINERKNQ